MDIAYRISVLQEQHDELNRKIDSVEKSRVFDDLELAELKKKRLHIKDELAILHKQQFEEQHERLDLDGH